MVLVDQGTNAYLSCQVDANPITEDMIRWRRRTVCNSLDSDEADDGVIIEDSPNSERMRQTVEKNRCFLIIYNVSREDSGCFDCVAFNGIGERDLATANLVVKRKHH